MKNRRRVIAVSLAGSLLSTLLIPLDCQAGCLSDWLFRRKTSKNLATAVPAPTVTVGYPPGSTCGAAFCQQTVVRYMPQIAYRTAYQPVPVTTYQTSTSINPASGLPMTCTRPCTSYKYQAQRVPYTTYRPVYTTVPVTLPPTGSVQPTPVQGPTTAPIITPNTSLYPPSYRYGYQPATGVGCQGCQGGATSVPGPVTTPPAYAPGSGWSTTTPPTQNPPGATPWTPVAPNSFATPAPTGGPVGATPWQPVPGGGVTSPSPQGTTPADVAPSLRPAIPEASQRSLRPVPLPESFQDSSGDKGSANNGVGGGQSRLFTTPGGDNGMDSRDNQQRYRYGSRPELQEPTGTQLQGPANQNLHETRSFDSRAVRDLDRQRGDAAYGYPWSNTEDKTAWSEPSLPATPTRIAREPQQLTRRDAVPLRWAVDDPQTQSDNRGDPTSQDWQWQRENRTTTVGWSPAR